MFQGIHALLNQCPKLTHLSLTGVQAFFLREDLISFCREAPPGLFPLSSFFSLDFFFSRRHPNHRAEFTDHQRNMFCVFSGEGVNRLRNYLNEDPESLYNAEGTMFDDREGEDGDADQQVTGLLNATGLGADDDDVNEEDETGEGSQYGGEADG